MGHRAALRFGTPELLFSLSVALLVIVVAVPMLLIFFSAFWVDGHFNVADVIKVLQHPETYKALLNSLILSVGVTITGTIVGTFFAWLVTRTDLPFKKTMKLLFLVPFMLPAFIGALAWRQLLGPVGYPAPIGRVPRAAIRCRIRGELARRPTGDGYREDVVIG